MRWRGDFCRAFSCVKSLNGGESAFLWECLLSTEQKSPLCLFTYGTKKHSLCKGALIKDEKMVNSAGCSRRVNLHNSALIKNKTNRANRRRKKVLIVAIFDRRFTPPKIFKKTQKSA